MASFRLVGEISQRMTLHDINDKKLAQQRSEASPLQVAQSLWYWNKLCYLDARKESLWPKQSKGEEGK